MPDEGLAAPARRAPSEPAAPIFLHVFPATLSRSLPSATVDIAVRYEGNEFGELTARGGVLSRGHVRVRLGAYPRSRDAVGLEHRACSFLVDCDEPIVRALLEPTRATDGKPATIRSLQTFVHRYIESKGSRSFDIASVVARRREGDCSEHAVLLTALARLHGYAARVVLGLVIVRVGERDVGAFGHAWTEYHDDKEWRVADAALPIADLRREAGKQRLYVNYLPIRVLKREDAGFASEGVVGASVLHVTRVDVSSMPAAPTARKTARR
jgi:transglutaminase-like putative cysteine protease